MPPFFVCFFHCRTVSWAAVETLYWNQKPGFRHGNWKPPGSDICGGGLAHLPAASRRAWTARASPARPEVDSGARFWKRGVLLTPRFFFMGFSCPDCRMAWAAKTHFNSRNDYTVGIKIFQDTSMNRLNNMHRFSCCGAFDPSCQLSTTERETKLTKI